MTKPTEAVGAYENKSGGPNWLYIVLGLLAVLILAILLFSLLGGDDEVEPVDTLERDTTTTTDDSPVSDAGAEEFGE